MTHPPALSILNLGSFVRLAHSYLLLTLLFYALQSTAANLQYQHTIAEAVETVLLGDGFLVGLVNEILTSKGADQHHEAHIFFGNGAIEIALDQGFGCPCQFCHYLFPDFGYLQNTTNSPKIEEVPATKLSLKLGKLASWPLIRLSPVRDRQHSLTTQLFLNQKAHDDIPIALIEIAAGNEE